MTSGRFLMRIRDFIKLRGRKLLRSLRFVIRKLRFLEPRIERSDIQGNILRGYGFRSAYYLFVHVPDGEEQVARRWLLRLCDQVMSSEDWRDGRNPQHALNVALSCAGLKALGLPDHVLDWFPKEYREGMRDPERAQLLGDTGTSAPDGWTDGWATNEPEPHLLLTILAQDRQVARERARMILGWDPDKLEETGEDPDQTTPDDLDLRIPAELILLRGKTSMKAGLFRHPDLEREDSREHFGFADGFSQPSIRGMPATPSEQGMGTLRKRGRWAGLAPGEFVLGYPGEDGVAPESLGEGFIIPESPGRRRMVPESPPAPLGRSGSFMVVRKLEQHVDRFRSYLRNQALNDLPFLRHLTRPQDEKDAARIAARQRVLAAKIVGRWHDGTSLVLHPDGPPPKEDEKARDPSAMNDFTYGIRDDEGFGCPLGAHVRRANPRDDLGWFGSLTRRHRIVRRGMPYGDPSFRAYQTNPKKKRKDWQPKGLFDPHFFDIEGQAEKERGLMFICFQASIARQFEIIQGQWLNNGDSFWLGKEKDFLTMCPQDGATTNGADGETLPSPDLRAAGRMTIQGREQPSFLSPKEDSFVTLKGGEYFFAPGLSALRALASGYWL
jgi:Dyp-type peroxidase family